MNDKGKGLPKGRAVNIIRGIPPSWMMVERGIPMLDSTLELALLGFRSARQILSYGRMRGRALGMLLHAGPPMVPRGKHACARYPPILGGKQFLGSYCSGCY